MRLHAALFILLAGCDGGGAEVNLTQDQGQTTQPPELQPVVTPIDDGCDITCNRRFDGFIDVIQTCRNGISNIEVLQFLPHNCDRINDVFPSTSSGTGSGFSGQSTH